MKLQQYSTRWAGVVTHWLISENSGKCMAPGNSERKLDPVTFRKMSEQPQHKIFVFFGDDENMPIGLVALSNIDLISKTARIWYLIGDKDHSNNDMATKAVNECLSYGFLNLGLESIYAWMVCDDRSSGQILTKNHFNFIGRRRQCHPADGKLYDRMLYDLLSTEFLEYNYEQYRSFLQHNEQSSLSNFSYR